MSKLGRYMTGTSCFYIKRREDVDEAVLRELISCPVGGDSPCWELYYRYGSRYREKACRQDCALNSG